MGESKKVPFLVSSVLQLTRKGTFLLCNICYYKKWFANFTI